MGTGPPGKKWAKTWAAGWSVSVRERKDTSSREQSRVWRGGGDTDGPPAGAARASAPRLAGPGPGERGGRAPTVRGPRGRRRGPGQLRPRTGSLLLSLFRPSLGLVGCPTNSDEPVAPPAKAGARAGVKARVFCTVFFGGQLTLVIISTCAFRNANPGLSLSPGTGLPCAPSRFATRAPARAGGRRRAGEGREEGAEAPLPGPGARGAWGCAGMSGGAGWGCPALFPAGGRRLCLRWRRLQAAGLRHCGLHPGGLRARRRRQLRREGRWGLRLPAQEPGLAAGWSARRIPLPGPTPSRPASFGGRRLCLCRGSDPSEEGA